MTNQKSQQAKRQKLLDALLAGDCLSKLEILRRFRLWNSGAAISQFRKDGWNIETTMSEKRGERFAIYSIPKEV